MKLTKILLLIALYASATQTTAQEFYWKAGLGYAIAVPGQQLDQYGNVLNGTVTNSGNYTSFSLKSASFTAGLHAMAGAGILLSKNIGAELDADWNIAPRKYTQQMNGLSGNGTPYDYTAERKEKGSLILIPSLLLQANPASWQPYMRMGIALPLMSGITLDETYRYAAGDVHRYSWNITNYFSVGFAAAAGTTMKLSKSVTLFAEASLLYLSPLRKEKVLESANINGTNYPVSQLSGGIKDYHYSRNAVANQYGNEEAFSQPYSNISFAVGIHHSLHGSKKAPKESSH